MEALASEIRSLFSRVCNVPEERIDMEANIFKEYGINSVRAIKLLSNLEVHYDVDIPDGTAQTIATLNDVVRVVAELRGTAS